ncbi:hypothetical protein N7534_001451 [Penicillium rubens]|nr:hypothetical protein N7534_001451 [Penicillium rubens]
MYPATFFTRERPYTQLQSAAMTSHPSAKRKPYAPSGPRGAAGPSRKRAKTFDARTLAVQSADAALSATGELDVAAYSAARAFEIQALEEGMQRSKNALTTRAFQKVPRSLRRRTASHNVKRVPRRLRARAKREVFIDNDMAEDNTPTVTARRRKPSRMMRIRLDTARRLQAINSKTKARRAAAKLRRDQANQTSLEKEGSHAFDIAPRVPKIKKNKLSRPLPAEPKYRKRQRCKTWLPTHLYHAKRAHMATTKDPIWRFAVPLSPTEQSYRPTHRARGARGAVAWDMSYMSTIQLEGAEPAIQAVLMAVGVKGDNVWGSKGKKWRAGTRSLQAWAFEKDHTKRPTAPVTLIWCAKQEDVEMVDADEPQPKSSKKDHRKLWIRVHPSAFLQLWTDVLAASKSQSPPYPRLHFPPRTLHVSDNESHMNNLAMLLSTWHPDKTQGPSKLFDRTTRLTAARQLPSQKAINRRRTLAGPGEYPPSQPSDPQIPIMILANKPQARAKRSNAPGSWTVLLPWKCVVPVWYSIMFYPLSSGGNPLLGGLKQQRQLAFEAGEAWFPGDFPGTRAGWEWGQRETETSRRDWERRPKGRRPEFDNISLGDGRPKGEIGHGWACDWERLLQGPKQDDATTGTADGSSVKKPTASKEADKNDPSTPIIPPLDIHNVRLPPADTYQSLNPALRQKWLDLGSARTKKPGQPKLSKAGNAAPESEEARRLLAKALISTTDGEPDSEPLEVPTEDDLIGFVTTGNYNLSEGKGTGIGSIQLSKVLAPGIKLSERRMCIIRAAGEKSGRLGVWEFV